MSQKMTDEEAERIADAIIGEYEQRMGFPPSKPEPTLDELLAQPHEVIDEEDLWSTLICPSTPELEEQAFEYTMVGPRLAATDEELEESVILLKSALISRKPPPLPRYFYWPNFFISTPILIK